MQPEKWLCGSMSYSTLFGNMSNLSSLVFGIDENNSQDHEPYLTWFRRLRSFGYIVIVVDHTGKDPRRGNRGSSKKIEWINANIQLSRINTNSLRVQMGKCRMPIPEVNSFNLRDCLKTKALNFNSFSVK